MEDFSDLMAEQYTLVDVRTPEEFEQGALPNAINISVTALNFPLEIAIFQHKLFIITPKLPCPITTLAESNVALFTHWGVLTPLRQIKYL